MSAETGTRAEGGLGLREPGLLMRFATVKPDGAPYATAIWYAYEEGALWFTPRKQSVWRQHLLRDPRIAIVIDEQALPYRPRLPDGVVAHVVAHLRVHVLRGHPECELPQRDQVALAEEVVDRLAGLLRDVDLAVPEPV